jgi:hypothetical protein
MAPNSIPFGRSRFAQAERLGLDFTSPPKRPDLN